MLGFLGGTCNLERRIIHNLFLIERVQASIWVLKQAESAKESSINSEIALRIDVIDDELAHVDANSCDYAQELLLLAERYRFIARLFGLDFGGVVAHALNVLHLLHHWLGLSRAAKQL